MVKTKLTLFIDESTIEQMKIQAIKEKTSVSLLLQRIFNEYKQKQSEKVR